MTTKQQYFMTDFASTDKRSARAHLEGRNLRVPMYLAFEAAESLIGRAAKAPADYKRIANFAYRKIPVLANLKHTLSTFVVAATGLLAGMALALYFLSQ